VSQADKMQNWHWHSCHHHQRDCFLSIKDAGLLFPPGFFDGHTPGLVSANCKLSNKCEMWWSRGQPWHEMEHATHPTTTFAHRLLFLAKVVGVLLDSGANEPLPMMDLMSKPDRHGPHKFGDEKKRRLWTQGGGGMSTSTASSESWMSHDEAPTTARPAVHLVHFRKLIEMQQRCVDGFDATKTVCAENLADLKDRSGARTGKNQFLSGLFWPVRPMLPSKQALSSLSTERWAPCP